MEKSATDERTFTIERLAVAPEARHRGFGALLLSYALNRITENGGTVASIALMDNNEVLKQWYQGKGFAQTGRRTFEHLPFAVCFMAGKLTDESVGTDAGRQR